MVVRSRPNGIENIWQVSQEAKIEANLPNVVRVHKSWIQILMDVSIR